jgi:ribosomal protein L20
MSNIYKVNSLEDYKKQREEKVGLKNLFLERIDPKKSKEEITKQLISALKKNGWKLSEKNEN